MYLRNFRKNLLERNNQRGFTLVEIMVVVVILGLLVGLVGPAIWKNLSKASIKTATAQMSGIHAALDLYRLDNNRYPDNLEDLIRGSGETWDGPYLEDGKLPKDPWGNDYLYNAVESGKNFKLSSAGDGNEPIVYR